MKKTITITLSLLLIGLLTACGGKNETAVCEKNGINLSFSYPKGFFTRSDDAKDFILGEKNGYAFVGKDFTMQVTMGISFGKAELWDRVKQNKIDDKNALFKEIKIAGTIDAYQFYWEPCPAYTILLENNRYIEIQFCPNDLKSLTDSEVRSAGREKRAEFLENSKAILELPTVQDIVKSLKVILSDIDD